MHGGESGWRWLLWGGFVAAVLLMLVLANWPQPPLLPGSPSDIVQHASGFAVLTLAARQAFRDMRWQALAIGLSAFGLGIEIVQGLLPFGRNPSLQDWLIDCLAIGAMLACVGIYQKLGQWWRAVARR